MPGPVLFRAYALSSSIQEYQLPKASSSALTGNHPCLLGPASPKFMSRRLIPQGSADSKWQGKTLWTFLGPGLPVGLTGGGFSCNHIVSWLCPCPVLLRHSLNNKFPENALPINLLHTNPCIGAYFQGTQTETWCDVDEILREFDQ